MCEGQRGATPQRCHQCMKIRLAAKAQNLLCSRGVLHGQPAVKQLVRLHILAGERAVGIVLLGKEAAGAQHDAIEPVLEMRQPAKLLGGELGDAVGAVGPGQVGLGFRPARRRAGRVDIDGALWVDSTARALTDLEFRYIGLPRELERFEPGGRISFEEMPNGIPLISSWSIRLASAHAGTAPGARTIRDRRGRVVRIEIDDTGGQLAEAVWPDGTAWRAPLGTVRLRAATSDGLPATNRVVRLLDSSYEAVTDSMGVAEIGQVLPGRTSVQENRPTMPPMAAIMGSEALFKSDNSPI